MKSPWIDQKSVRASAPSVGSVGWDSPNSLWSSLLKHSLLTVGSRLGASEWVLGIRALFLTILLNNLLLGIWIHLSFVIQILLSHWFFEDKFLMRPTFPPNLLNPLSEYLLSKFHPRSAESPERCQVILSCRIDEFLINLSVKSNDIQPLLQKVLLVLWLVLQIIFHKEFSFLSARRSWTFRRQQ